VIFIKSGISFQQQALSPDRKMKNRKRSISMKKWLGNNPHPMLGKRHSEETIRKIKEENVGKKRSEATRKRMSEAKKGMKLSEELKKKLSELKKGKKLSEEHRRNVAKANAKKNRGKTHPMYGKHHSKETKKKISEAMSGERSPFWLGGKSFEPYGIEWNKDLRDQIRKRDDYTCQIGDCRKRENGKPFPIHHVDYDKRNNKKENLITLCVSCHQKTNFNREYWKGFLSDLLIKNQLNGGKDDSFQFDRVDETQKLLL